MAPGTNLQLTRLVLAGLVGGLWALLIPAPALAAEPAGQAPAALRFAEHLYAERDYYRAIGEYKRFLFETPESSLAGWVRLRIGQSYLAGERFSAAQSQFLQLSRQATDDRLRVLAGVSLARSFYRDGRLLQTLAVLDGLEKELADPQLRGAAWYLSGCANLRLGDLIQAESAFARIWAGHALAERAGLLLARLGEGFELPSKNPVVAGLLSIVPGLGHFYLEEYATGITALAWNGLFAVATYEAFRHRQWGVGALLAALELLWYSGAIYGAVSGAERYNRDAERNFLDRLDRLAGLDAEVPDDSMVTGILLTGRF